MRLPERADDQVRLGVAIALPEPLRSDLQRARAGFGDPLAWSIVPHVTLIGPTVVDVDALPEVDAHLARIAASHAPFALHLRGTGSFRPVSDVVFVQVVEGIAACEDLERDLRTGPLAQPLRFHYHPHVTVAHDVPADALDRAFDELAGFDARFDAAEVQVFDGDDTGVWRIVDALPLGG
ncbi:2'-5' RNA ligase family protein [Actinotalea sp. M2MS4P-6]|uniref:2'-5' RNA ligase family protein n=1 Tax=Actinotalea sp. M2MS4P-6 TaxID=2983762 RepID=UPI0021E4F18E|nr:2'-5' RNA ligase family protein [Actinotalea sp. M2MS4P-6]MCV2393482.1 2'-5' RNA ligase family protein [Actinotalea sp. M2MS4P-6]